MYRFMKVIGKPGLLVADPFRPPSGTPHFLGQREKSPAPEGDKLNLVDFFEPCEQIVKVDAAGRKHVFDAKAHGDLVVLAECVAATHEKAAVAMAKPTAKSGKGGE